MKEKVGKLIRKKPQNRYKKGRVLVLFVLLVFGCGITGESRAHARVSTVEEIRVGLKSKYAGKQSITLYNSQLEVGYCDGRTYETETILSGEDGIRVTPQKGFFFEVPEEFSLQAAEKLAKQLEDKGAKAYAVMLSKGKARLYFPIAENGTSETDAREKCREAAGECGILLDSKRKESAYLIRIDAGSRVLFAEGAEGDYPQFAATAGDEDGIFTVDLGSQRYRGRIEIGRYGGKQTVTAVNVVPLEEYLYGVVPCEMPASWHMEALKAQAVCARSYALMKAGYHAETDIKRGFRMVDTVQSQVYGGVSREHVRSNSAVNATKGETLCYENRTVTGYYFSASGGHTESVEDVWGFAIPYLQGVPDIYETKPSKKPWSVTLEGAELERLLLSQGNNVGTIKKVMQEIVTSTGRVYSLRVIGSLGSVALETDALRNVLELASTKFKVISPGMTPDLVAVQGAATTRETAIHDCYVISGDGDVQSAKGLTDQYVVLSADNLTNFPRSAPNTGEYVFAGMGHGHGVGMSQSGAYGMAEHGFDYTEILEHYFTGISVR